MEHDAEFRSPGQRAGFIANTEGHLRHENPWQEGTHDHAEWMAGWDWANEIRADWEALYYA